MSSSPYVAPTNGTYVGEFFNSNDPTEKGTVVATVNGNEITAVFTPQDAEIQTVTGSFDESGYFNGGAIIDEDQFFFKGNVYLRNNRTLEAVLDITSDALEERASVTLRADRQD